MVEPRRFGIDVDMYPDSNFWLAMAVVPMFWWSIHAFMGMYTDVRRRHRGKELRQVFQAGVIGGVLLYFALLIDDVTQSHIDQYQTLAVWLGSHLGLVVMGRWFLTSIVVGRVQSGDWAFLTIVVGDDETIIDFSRILKKLLAATVGMSWRA